MPEPGERKASLDGLRVVVTASRRAAELSSLIAKMGGEPIVVPTVGITVPTADGEIEPFLREAIKGLDHVVFMTGTGVQMMMRTAERLCLATELKRSLNSPTVTVVARSGKPRAVLAKHGVKTDISPQEPTTEGVVRLLGPRVGGKKVGIVWQGSTVSWARERLLRSGASEVRECSPYRYSTEIDETGASVLGSMGFNFRRPNRAAIVDLITSLTSGRPCDAITFTSPPAVENLLVVAEEEGMRERLLESLGNVVVVAVGPSTREAIEEGGASAQVMPEVPGMGAMVNALGRFVARTRGETG